MSSLPRLQFLLRLSGNDSWNDSWSDTRIAFVTSCQPADWPSPAKWWRKWVIRCRWEKDGISEGATRKKGGISGGTGRKGGKGGRVSVGKGGKGGAFLGGEGGVGGGFSGEERGGFPRGGWKNNVVFLWHICTYIMLYFFIQKLFKSRLSLLVRRMYNYSSFLSSKNILVQETAKIFCQLICNCNICNYA